MAGAVGLRVDPARNLLWACASDSAQQVYPSIDAFDLDSGEHLASHGFDSPGLCNDLVLDDDGNVYATDSFGHRIFRVAAEDALDDGVAETWLADPTFVVPPEQFGLNGIVWDAGSLWVGVYADGRVFEIEVADDGSPGTVTLAGEPGTLAGPDGMLAHDGAVLVVEGLAARLSRLDLGDLSVTPLAEGFDFPTTVAVVGDTAWVAQGQFDHLYGIDPNPPSLPFLVRRVPLR